MWSFGVGIAITVLFACQWPAGTAQSHSPKSLSITILYESLCPDSVAFFKNQLRPNYNDLEPYIDVNLVPFGKSQSFENGAQFECQHGPKECEGNRIQSCVLAATDNQAAKVEFASCQMRGRAEPSGHVCANSAGIPANIEECVQSSVGTHLQLDAEAQTAAYAPTFIPTIVYDGTFRQDLQNASLKNFRRVVCELLAYRVERDDYFNSICNV